MAKKLKSVGLTVVAVFLLSAAFAVAAQAQEFHSDAEAGKTTTLAGEQSTENVFKTNQGTIKCKKSTLGGSMVGASAEMIALHPTYSECTQFGQAATANSEEIYYTYTWTIPLLWYHMRVSIGPSPLAFTAASSGCVVTIGEQTVDHIKFETKEVAGVKHLFATYEISGLKYTAGSKCSKPGTFEDGTYTGTQTIKGTNEAKKATSVWVE
jgi:hypothetical protein